MPVKEGDLVVRNSRQSDTSVEYRFRTAVVLCDPYVSIFSNKDVTGKAFFSEEKIVVDLLVGTEHLKKIPVDLIDKYER